MEREIKRLKRSWIPLVKVCVLSYLKWLTTFEDNLFGLYGDEDLTNLAKCLIIENEDFVKEIAVCLYIRSMSSTSWIVQDIRHKLGNSTSSTYGLYLFFFINNYYIEPTKFEIQEMVSILSGEAY
ncbi:hypothetical protein Tco_1232259 [Tanacetum coccineum]